MGFFDRLKPEPKQTELENRSMFSSSTFSSIFATNSWMINEDKVMKIPTAVACLDIISNAIAQMPIYLYKEHSDGSIEKIENDNRVFLLNEESNQLMNGYNFKKQMTKDFLLYGGSFTYAEKKGNEVDGLYLLPARNIFVTKYITDAYKVTADIRLATIEGLPNGPSVKKEITFKPYELMISVLDSNDGITTVGLLQKGEKIFQQAYDEMEYTFNIFQRGALPLGILKMAGRLSQGAVDKLRESWNNLYSGSKNAAKTVILEDGMEYQPLSMKPSDLQLNDSKSATNSEICKLFGVPESMISVQQNKYNSIEQNQLNFLKHTLAPIINAFESAANRALLLENEKSDGFFFRFDTSEILRATEKERIEAVQAGWQGGLFTINEARNKLDLPSIDENVFMWGLQSVLFNPETGEMKVPNMGMTGGPGQPGQAIPQTLGKGNIDASNQSQSNQKAKPNGPSGGKPSDNPTNSTKSAGNQSPTSTFKN